MVGFENGVRIILPAQPARHTRASDPQLAGLSHEPESSKIRVGDLLTLQDHTYSSEPMRLTEFDGMFRKPGYAQGPGDTPDTHGLRRIRLWRHVEPAIARVVYGCHEIR